MTPTGKITLALAILLTAGLLFGAGYLTNGYVARGELLESYNGANRMRQDARADAQEMGQFVERLNDQLQGGPLPEETPVRKTDL